MKLYMSLCKSKLLNDFDMIRKVRILVVLYINVSAMNESCLLSRESYFQVSLYSLCAIRASETPKAIIQCSLGNYCSLMTEIPII